MILVLLLVSMGLGFANKSNKTNAESKIKSLSTELAAQTDLNSRLLSNLKQLQSESDRLLKERQTISELNVKYKSNLDRIQNQLASELDSIQTLRQTENETVRNWIDTDVPADVIGMLKYARSESDHSNGNQAGAAASRLPAAMPGK
ncbi:hypothetical protein [Alishewanella sp. SMS8]|uniref:hypothetical protein n=1 Tax=Alishewanella sp. SMS8 TaxID=2994676 RepID=UPI002741DE06|nr:hypothetical protein [Alishewanella sp. SMS8]MDP5205805.1 hypothetical protein [Alishewanella sp. SMS9]MDP5459877.1 hypothetical protein [Alishewanella sp. SMS8]